MGQPLDHLQPPAAGVRQAKILLPAEYGEAHVPSDWLRQSAQPLFAP